MSTQFEPQLFSIHPRQRRDAMTLYERVLCGGRRLGAKVYVMHGPVHLAGAARNIGIGRIAPIFRELSDVASAYGITLTLENVSWCVFNTPEFGRSLRESLGDDRLKFTLDVKQAVRSGQDPLAFVDALGTGIVNVHLCGAEKMADGRLALSMPGRGSFDFAALHAALQRQKAKYAAFIEVYSDMYSDFSELYDSFARMRTIFKEQ